MPATNTTRLSFSKPLKLVRQLFSKKTLRLLIDQFNNPNQSDGLKAFSAAFGIFMGIIPIWGLQTVAAIFLSVMFKFNRALVLLFAQISLPPLMPLIVFLSYRVGQIWLNDVPARGHGKAAMHSVNQHLWQYLYGSVTLAITLGIITGVVTYSVLKLMRLAKEYQVAAWFKRMFGSLVYKIAG
jgi:uncharacterized protein (DUF2062 family)